jgi:hypothetical protein
MFVRPASVSPPPSGPIAAPASPIDARPRAAVSSSGGTKPEAGDTGHAVRSAKATIPLTDASIKRGGRVLARFVGPIALVLSRRAAQDAQDERGYFELLAAHLSDPGERSQFFRDLRRQS